MSLRTFTDQLGNKLNISFPPQRIISLVPSQTELLSDLGLDSQVVGITKFCVHPESWTRSKVIVGGTKNFRFEVIDSLKPDLIIGNKEENYQEGIDRLRNKFPVWMSDISTLTDAVNMIHDLGELTNTISKANEIKRLINTDFSQIQKLPPFRALYLIWKNPWMGAGTETFIHEMMAHSGLHNCLSDQRRYPEMTDESISKLNPELILLSSEPYPFQQKHVVELQQICPNAKVVLVDGEMFSWYGSRLTKFPEYLKSFNPALL